MARIERDALFAHVGAICVQATWLEQALEEAITNIAGYRAAAVVRGQRGSNLTSALRRLVDEDAVVGPEYREVLLDLAKRADKALAERDFVVHAVWLVKTNRPGLVTGTRTRASGPTQREWSFQGLGAVEQEQFDVREALRIWSHNAVAEERDWEPLPTPS